MLREEISKIVLEALLTTHYKNEKNGYRLKDMFDSNQMSPEVYKEILSKLNFLENIEFPSADIAIKVYSSPTTFTTNEPNNKSYDGNDFWIVINNNNILSLMNRPLRDRPKNADFYLSFEYIQNLNKDSLNLHDLNPANKVKKVGARFLRSLDKMPKLNIGSEDWFIDVSKELAYLGQDVNKKVSFEKLLDLAKSPSDFKRLEPLIKEVNERRRLKRNI